MRGAIPEGITSLPCEQLKRARQRKLNGKPKPQRKRNGKQIFGTKVKPMKGRKCARREKEGLQILINGKTRNASGWTTG